MNFFGGQCLTSCKMYVCKFGNATPFRERWRSHHHHQETKLAALMTWIWHRYTRLKLTRYICSQVTDKVCARFTFALGISLRLHSRSDVMRAHYERWRDPIVGIGKSGPMTWLISWKKGLAFSNVVDFFSQECNLFPELDLNHCWLETLCCAQPLFQFFFF